MITLPVVGMKSSNKNTKKILSPVVGMKSSNNNEDEDDELLVTGEKYQSQMIMPYPFPW